MQKAFVAWAESGAPGEVYFPAGAYRINDEFTAGIMSTASDTVAKYIYDGGLNRSNPGIEQWLVVKGEFGATWIVVDSNFESSETNFYGKVLLRFEQPSKLVTGPFMDGMCFYCNIARAPLNSSGFINDDRKKCPVVFKGVNVNFCFITNLVVRGNYEWHSTAVILENINNSFFANWRLKAGLNYGIADSWRTAGGSYDVTTSGSRIVDNTSSNAFTNPPGRGDSH